MPGKNIVKSYLENGYYHLYNHIVGNELLYKDPRDYQVFLYLLKKYLSDEENNLNLLKIVNNKSLSKEVFLLCYCLMPNHYHLIVQQKNKDGITKLIRRICTNYSMYFNKKYKRRGTLFQSRYKAVLILTDEQLVHLSRYIHLNPKVKNISPVLTYPFSSIEDYLGNRNTKWLYAHKILEIVCPSGRSPFTAYKKFISGYLEEEDYLIKDLILEGPTLTRVGP